MLERVAELVNGDPAIVRWGRHMNESFMVEVGDVQYLVTVREGKVESVAKGPFVMRSWRFAIRGRALGEVLGGCRRPAGTISLRCSGAATSPSRATSACLMAYLLYVKLLLAAPRRLAR